MFPTLRDAKAEMETQGGEIIKDRAKREPIKDFIAKSRPYLDWVVATKFEPGDYGICKTIRSGWRWILGTGSPLYVHAGRGRQGRTVVESTPSGIPPA